MKDMNLGVDCDYSPIHLQKQPDYGPSDRSSQLFIEHQNIRWRVQILNKIIK